MVLLLIGRMVISNITVKYHLFLFGINKQILNFHPIHHFQTQNVNNGGTPNLNKAKTHTN